MKRIAIFSVCFMVLTSYMGCSKATSGEKPASTDLLKAGVNVDSKTTSPVADAPRADIVPAQKFVAVADVMGEWQCVTEQDVMKLNLEESFGEKGRATTEGIIEFIVPNGPSLNLYIKGESRWALEESKLCDTPTDVALTQTSGAPNPLVDQLLAGIGNRQRRGLTVN